MTSQISAATPVELLSKVYQRHGWTRSAGESRAARVAALYEIRIDHQTGRYVAVEKAKETP